MENQQRHSQTPQNDNPLQAHRISSVPNNPTNLKKKEGFLYKQSEHLKQWRKRYFVCENNFLKISHNIEGDKLVIVDLNDYAPSWKGPSGDKFAFYFLARPGMKSKSKIEKLKLGSSDEGLARDWFKFFLSVMDIRSILPGQSVILDEIGARMKSQSDKSLNVHTNMSNNSNDSNTIAITNENLLPHIMTLSKRKRSTSLGEKNNDQTKESSSEADQIIKVEKVEKVVEKDTSRTNLSVEVPKTYNEQSFERENNNVKSNRPSTASHFSKSHTHNRAEKIPRKSSRQQHPHEDVEFRLPKEAPKWVEQLFEKHVKGKSMWKTPTEEKVSFDDWNIVHDNGQFRILQSVKKQNVFKCLYSLENGASPEKLLQVLLDVQNRNEWDRSFNKGKFLSYIPSTKQCIIHQVNKAYGMLYFPREFVYARYVFKTMGDFFIIDKSVSDVAQVKKSLRCPRGEIFYSITQIKKMGHEIYLNMLLRITNGGLVNAEQDTQMTINSLMNFNNIIQILNDYEGWDQSKLAFMPNSDHEVVAQETIALELNVPVSDYSPIEPKNRAEESSIISYSGSFSQSQAHNSSKDESFAVDSQEETKESPVTANFGGKPNTHNLEEESDEVDLNALLDKVNKQQTTLECIDPNVPIKKLSKSQESAIIPNEENDLLNGKTWKRDPANGLKFIDDEFLSKQKKVLGYFLRSMGKNFLEGKSIMNVSMPITIFGNESMLQRLCSSYGYGIPLLELAGRQTDKIEAFKYAVAAFFSGGVLGIAQVKPFNPILGETYQGYLNGIPIYCEQICHHPPISGFYMKSEDFFLHGNQQLEASLGANSATASDKRRMCVTLPKLNMDIYAYFPTALVSGTAWGQRYFNWSKKLRVYDPQNNLYVEMVYNPDEKGMIGNLFSKKTLDADKAIGSIYRVKPEFMCGFHVKESLANVDSQPKFNSKEHAVEELSKGEGCWTGYLGFDGKRYWDSEKTKPYKLIDQPNKALPSDSNFREDLIYKKMNDLERGQVSKDRLENIQRDDRKLRAKTSSKTKH